MIKKGFTLAEIMIVLAVIGVLTAVLLPVAINSTPNEDIMKFKKGHNALLTAIRELANSDKYYLDGDLGIRADGQLLDGTHTEDEEYFCLSFADIINSSDIKCEQSEKYSYSWVDLKATPIEENKERLDTVCKTVDKEFGVVTQDKIVFYDYNSKVKFGMNLKQAHEASNIESGTINETTRGFGGYKVNGFDVIYKTFCMDIDGIGKGEDPFGYGIRADGKVLPGARADEWLQKSIQEKE